MITKQEFDNAAKDSLSKFRAYFPKMVSFKNYVQSEILNRLNQRELLDVMACRLNPRVVYKLAFLAKGKWQAYGDAQSLYCAAMAVATIIKEYDWGTSYLTSEGLWEMASKIQSA